ncbi:MAG: glycosyltransferase family 2 protein [Candidatus Coatesbacteria bacterium]|nr:glycosyltransferase family 2 protein [Candidatus Coatesbacteria bacterium]
MTKARLTAIIPTFNEEANIRDCLEQLRFADEILVVDSFSTDSTLDIAKEFNARIIQREYNCSASQKNWAIPQAKHEWILLCDSDERVTAELRREIEEVLAGEQQHVGYSIPRANYFLGKRIRHCGWSPERDRNIRLFMRDKSRYEDKEVHADIICDGSVGKLHSPLMHHSFRTFEQYIAKMNRYTTWGAKDLINAGRKIGTFDLTFRPPMTFLKMYILQAGFLDGMRGFILCLASSFYTLSKYTKAWLMGRSSE